jgi:hypothetical protein
MADTFSGVWHSNYTYTSSSRSGEFQGEHYVKMMQDGDKLIVESLPEVNPSYLILKLKVDDNDGMVTGSWQESTREDGYYKGAVYYGAIQMAVEKTGKELVGKWLGFGKDRAINVGPWKFTYLGETLPEDAKSLV